MNSVIQQLYMMPSLRKGILEVENATQPIDNNNAGAILLFQFKVMLIVKKVDIICNAQG